MPRLHAKWDAEQDAGSAGCALHDGGHAAEGERLAEVEPGHLVACAGAEGGCARLRAAAGRRR